MNPFLKYRFFSDIVIFLNDFHYRVLNLDSLSSVNKSVILNGDFSCLSWCKMPLVFELMLGSDASLMWGYLIYTQSCAGFIISGGGGRQHRGVRDSCNTSNLSEHGWTGQTSSTKHSRIYEHRCAVCARSTHAEHSGLSMNKTCPHTAVFRTFLAFS